MEKDEKFLKNPCSRYFLEKGFFKHFIYHTFKKSSKKINRKKEGIKATFG